MHSRKLGISLGLLGALLFTLVQRASATDWSPKQVTCTWKYDVKPSRKTKKILLITLVPRSIKGRQEVISLKYSHRPKKVFTKHGNRYARWVFKNPRRPFTIRVDAVINLSQYDLSVAAEEPARAKRLPKKQLRKYLASEKYLEKNHRSIRTAARKIAGDTDQEKVRNIMAFIHGTVRPTSWYPTKKTYGAAGTLRKKKGVCADYSDLFVALCRAKKIPARVCEGYSVLPTKKGDTPQHAWVEAYIRKLGWVPFDAHHSFLAKRSIEKMPPYLIYLTGIRNDPTINRGHIWTGRFWPKAKIKLEFIVHKQQALAFAPRR